MVQIKKSHMKETIIYILSQIIVGRLIHVSDSKNIKQQGEFMGITLLLQIKPPCPMTDITAGIFIFYCISLSGTMFYSFVSILIYCIFLSGMLS